MPIEKNIIFNRIASTGALDTTTKFVSIPKEFACGNFWTTKTSLNTARSSTSRFTVDGFLYNSQGLTSGTGRTATTERYDDNLNSWTNRTNFNQSATSASASFVLSFAYSGYGIDSANTDLATLSAYNESSNAWTSKTTGGTGRRSCAAFSLNSYGYMTRGIRLVSGAIWQSLNEQYNESANSWVTKTAATTVGDGCTGFTLGGFGFSSHGRTAAGTYIATNLMYNDISNAWTTRSTSAGVARMATTGAVLNDLAHAIGGWNNANTAHNDQYNFITNVWTVRSPNLNALEAPATGGLNGNGYACGGDDGNVGTGLAHVTQYRNYHLLTISSVFKKTTDVPRSINVMATAEGISYNLPVQLRTDGSNWRFLTSGIKSDIKTGETTSAAYSPASGSHYKSYEVAIGIPPQFGLQTSGYWLTKSSLTGVNTEPGAFTLGGFAYVFGGENGASMLNGTQRYDDFFDIWTNLSPTVAHASKSMPGTFSLNGIGYSCTGTTDGAASGVTTSSQKYTQDINTWTSITASLAARFYSSYFALNSFGYVVGGGNSGASNTNDNQQYNDVTNAWIAKTAHATSFRNGSGFSLNGYGYTAYGFDGVVTSSARQYNDGANVWVLKASGANPRDTPSGFSILGKGFVSCGATSDNFTDEYNDAPNVWFSRTVNPQGRRRPTGTHLNNNGYMCGGYISSSLSTVTQYRIDIAATRLMVALTIDSVPLVIAASGTWAVRTNNPASRLGTSSVGINGKSLCALGSDNSAATNRADNFDDTLNSWTATGSVGTARRYAASFLEEGFGFVTGGRTFAGTAGITNHDRYDSGLGTWSTRTAVTEAKYGQTGFNSSAYGYVACGDPSNVVTRAKTVHRYDNTANSWTAMTDFPIGISFTMGFTINNIGYMSHGSATGPVNVSSTHMYNEANNSWVAVATGITPRNSGAGFSSGSSGYVACGSTGSLSLLLDEYLSASNVWVNRTSNGLARLLVSGSNVGTLGFACCGATATDISTQTPRMDRYTP